MFQAMGFNCCCALGMIVFISRAVCLWLDSFLRMRKDNGTGNEPVDIGNILIRCVDVARMYTISSVVRLSSTRVFSQDIADSCC